MISGEFVQASTSGHLFLRQAGVKLAIAGSSGQTDERRNERRHVIPDRCGHDLGGPPAPAVEGLAIHANTKTA
jgi:hypothetical protein